jgi:NADH-quinone oxidoreductase subunit K
MILILPGFVLLLGLTLVLSTTNALVLLMGVELVIGSAIALLLIGGGLHLAQIESQTFAVVALSVAAAQAAVSFALVLQLYRRYQTIDFNRLRQLGEPPAKN